MAKDNAQSSFQRGVMSLLILSLLDQEDMYGYNITHIKNKSIPFSKK